MLLQAERSQRVGAKKRKHEEEVAEAFKEYEERLKDVWVKMSGYIMYRVVIIDGPTLIV